MTWKSFLPLGLFAALVVMLAVGLTLKPRELDSEFINKPVPEFELEALLPGDAPVQRRLLFAERLRVLVRGVSAGAPISDGAAGQ